MNWFISYPRSGRTWQEERMVWIKRLDNPEYNKTLLWRDIGSTHLNYDTNHGPTPTPYSTKHFATDDNLFFMIRDAKAVATSFYHFLFQVTNYRISTLVERWNMPTEVNKFVRSPFGVERYCRFLNEAVEINCQHRCWYLHYEDAFSLSFLDELNNNVLLRPSRLSLEQKQHIRHVTSIDKLKEQFNHQVFRKGTIDSYKQELSDYSQYYIDEYMDKNCNLTQYRDRYLGKEKFHAQR